MPLQMLQNLGCGSDNPIAPQLPAAPAPQDAQLSNPGQGDHVFGDVVSAMETALGQIFGTGQGVLQDRMTKYNANLWNQWEVLKALDLGHGVDPPISNRRVDEIDEHNIVFGRYAQRLQWQMCEVVCTSLALGGNNRRVIAATQAAGGWRTDLNTRFDELMAHLIDQTAAERVANAVPGNLRHPAMSLDAGALRFNNHATMGPIIARYGNRLSGHFAEFLNEFQAVPKVWFDADSSWHAMVIQNQRWVLA